MCREVEPGDDQSIYVNPWPSFRSPRTENPTPPTGGDTSDSSPSWRSPKEREGPAVEAERYVWELHEGLRALRAALSALESGLDQVVRLDLEGFRASCHGLGEVTGDITRLSETLSCRAGVRTRISTRQQVAYLKHHS